MLRFFRQIRQTLLTDNKFSKYLLYAVGEILLVVIGILIALQIDNWNEEQKNKAILNVYYNQILQDFKADSLFIAQLSLHLDSNLVQYQAYKQKIEQPGFPLDSNIISMGNLNWYTSDVKFQTNTINTLQNTGDIKFVPPEIRKELIELKSLQDQTIRIQTFNNELYGERIGYANNFSGGGDFIAINSRNPKFARFYSDENRQIEWLLALQNAQEVKMLGERATLENFQQIAADMYELNKRISTEMKK